MKIEKFIFCRFEKLQEYIHKEIRIELKNGEKLFGIFVTGQFDESYEGDLLFYLKRTFSLLNHMNDYSYTGFYDCVTGWLQINKIKRKNNSHLEIIIDELSKNIEFKIIK